jgi:hypothetical protein
MRSATEDEQPIDFAQSAQFGLAQWSGLFEPADALFD